MAYIHAEDLATMFVGPFESAEAAQAHLDLHFPAYRKVPNSGYNDYVVDTPDDEYFFAVTPEVDIANWAEEKARSERKLKTPCTVAELAAFLLTLPRQNEIVTVIGYDTFDISDWGVGNIEIDAVDSDDD